MSEPVSPQRPPFSHLRTSDLLTRAGFVHAFFERGGGVSEGVFQSLNFTSQTGDSPSNVAQNLQVAAGALGVAPRKIYFLSQVHGTASVVVDGSEDATAIRQTEGDIVLTSTSDVVAAIRTADCVSVLLASPETGWVAACHAGWQGCVRGVVPETVRLLLEKGAGRLLAAIGPHISLPAFEVSDDVAEELINVSPEKEVVDRTQAKPHIDLRKLVRAQLVASGLQHEDIDDVQGCTVFDRDHFFSFRRDGNPSGRMLSAIRGGLQKNVA